MESDDNQPKEEEQETPVSPGASQTSVPHLSPGATEILDVTPVNSSTAGDDMSPSSAAREAMRINEDAFSSSSEEGDEKDSTSGDDPPQIPLEDAPGSSERQSEWDKALRRGKPNTGDASKFFSEQPEEGDQEYLTQAESNVVQEAAGAESSDTLDRIATGVEEVRPAAAPSSGSSSVASASVASTRASSRERSVSRNKYPPTVAPTSSTVSSKSGAPPVSSFAVMRPHPADNLSAGVLPDVLIAMRQRIESLTLFDSDMMRLAATSDNDPMQQESIESLKRSFHQSISAAVLVSLSHKRYERRRLAAMEIEKVVRSLLHQSEVERVRAILLLLSDDYVRSTSEDARKGGVVALAACAVGMKNSAEKENPILQECRDLILASVVHACQDHNQRVRYYATESLFNVVKIMPGLAIQHFFILFEILRSLYADVDVDVRSGAELLDKKLKEVIVNAINSGTFTVESCVPVFARFVYIRNKATKRLTLTWLQELSEKLVGAPILEFLHLFLSGIFDMIADPTVAIRQSALAFLQSVLPKILVLNTDTPLEENRMSVDFDKILQSLVTTMEHPDPFVRKVSMYWMSRIVKAHIGEDPVDESNPNDPEAPSAATEKSPIASAATVSVRNSVPHVLPGILLSIGDTYDSKAPGTGSSKDSFLPDQTTRSLAEQTNSCLQSSVRRDGEAYVQHLDGFIVALREELDSPGGMNSRHSAAVDRAPYRMDVNVDGTGIERPGWFRASEDEAKPSADDSLIMSRLCALHWIFVLYESVVPDLLKADYAREFVYAIIHQFVHNPPKEIVYKSLEVLAKITVPVTGEEVNHMVKVVSLSKLNNPSWASASSGSDDGPELPMTEPSIDYALTILGSERKKLTSRDREVFWALIQLHSYNENLLQDLTSVITYMCKLQPSEFVMVSFAVELDKFIRKKTTERKTENESPNAPSSAIEVSQKDLMFVSSVVQHMSHVLLNAEEASDVREALKDCVGSKGNSERDRQLSRVFHILLHSFSHNLASTLSICLWSGAYRTASLFLNQIDPLDINLVYLLEIDLVVELLERPLFRHLHVRMLERESDPESEGSGAMLFKTLKALSMIIPQSTCFSILRDRLSSVSRFRQSTISLFPPQKQRKGTADTESYVSRVVQVRTMHCEAAWKAIRVDSLETPVIVPETLADEGADKRKWLGYSSKEEESEAKRKYRDSKENLGTDEGMTIQEIGNEYDELDTMMGLLSEAPDFEANPGTTETAEDPVWRQYWADTK